MLIFASPPDPALRAAACGQQRLRWSCSKGCEIPTRYRHLKGGVQVVYKTILKRPETSANVPKRALFHNYIRRVRPIRNRQVTGSSPVVGSNPAPLPDYRNPDRTMSWSVLLSRKFVQGFLICQISHGAMDNLTILRSPKGALAL